MTVQVHLTTQTLESLQGTPEAKVPVEALRDYFRALGVDLSITQGDALARDPTEFEDTVDDYVAAHAPQPGTGGPAFLVVSDLGYRGLPVNGMLLDVRRRGACAVFTQASGFALGNAEDRFEIYAHEIGHMLNLTHQDADATDPTAMDSWDRRSEVSDRRTRWDDAIAGGPSDYAARLRGFFGNGNRHPVGLPMSARCCDKLLTSARSDVEPWLSEFSGDDLEDAQESPDAPLDCSLEVHGQEWAVGQPLDVTMTLRLKHGRPACEIPALLDRSSGELQLQLEQPDGRLRRLQSRRQACTSMRRWLRPRQTIRRHDSLFADRHDLVLSMPGRHRLRALVPQMHACSDWVTVNVAPPIAEFAAPAMQTFLRLGLPRGAEATWSEVNSLVSAGRMAPQVAANFASRAAGLGLRNFEGLRQFRKVASPAVAQTDALRRIALVRRAAHPNMDALHRAIDDAERLFAASDAQHPTLDYLAHLRRSILVQRRRRTR